MQTVTLCFLLRGDPPKYLLLGYKKRGFGVEKYTGIGGKIDVGETAADAAVRELQEEIGVRIATNALVYRGELTFLFPYRPAWDMHAHLFTATTWEGEPRESDEVEPVWFPLDLIPYALMWDDAGYWLPAVLRGETINGTFTFGEDNHTVEVADVAPLESDPPAQS